MIPIGALRTRLRSFLREQKPRSLPRKSSKPRIGTHVVNVQEGLRFVAQAGMSDELWLWLLEQGWRVESYRPDRRAYRDIPASAVTALIDADPARRQRLMAEAVLRAQSRSALARRLA